MKSGSCGCYFCVCFNIFSCITNIRTKMKSRYTGNKAGVIVFAIHPNTGGISLRFSRNETNIFWAENILPGQDQYAPVPAAPMPNRSSPDNLPPVPRIPFYFLQTRNEAIPEHPDVNEHTPTLILCAPQDVDQNQFQLNLPF